MISALAMIAIMMMMVIGYNAEEDGCSCSATGLSGIVDTGRPGCSDFLREFGDERFFCYINEPRACPTAEFSQAFPGATWRFCDPPAPPATVFEAIASIPELEVLQLAIEAAGLSDALSDPSANFTIFAPSNRAFVSALRPLGAVNASQILESEELVPILLYHVSAEIFTSEDIVRSHAALKVPTLSDAEFDDLTIVATRDRFRDRDYFKVVIEEKVFSSSKGFGAIVTKADIETGNGVIHIIDSVLRPPEDIATISTKIPRLGLFVKALEAADLVDAFSCKGGSCPLKPVTIFAPTDAAFLTLARELNVSPTELLELPQLPDILAYHVSNPENVTEPILVREIAEGVSIPTLGEGPLKGGITMQRREITTNRGGDLVIISRAEPTISGDINTAKIVQAANIKAYNGVIHLINNVLIPPSLNSTDIEVLDEPLSEEDSKLSIYDIITSRDDLSLLAAALDIPAAESVKLALEEVSADFSATLFAPNNDAFIELAGGAPIEEAILGNPELIDILLYHAVLGSVTSDQFSNEETLLESLIGLQIGVQVIGEDVILNEDTKVIEADIEALNGIIHVIDSVLSPADGALSLPEFAPVEDIDPLGSDN